MYAFKCGDDSKNKLKQISQPRAKSYEIDEKLN